MSNAVIGLAYYLKSKSLRRVGIFAPNTPAFLIAVYGIGAAGGVNVGMSYVFPVSERFLLVAFIIY